MKIGAPLETAQGKESAKDAFAPSDQGQSKTRADQRIQLNHLLRELREEVRDLADFVGKVKLGLTSITAGETYLKKTVGDITALFLEIEEVNRAFRNDTVRHITNLWEQMQANPVLCDPQQNLTQQELLHALTLLEDRGAKIVFAVGQLTIPHRLNRWLDKARTGYYVPFHQLFEDELPDPNDRLRVLRTIASAPKTLKAGIVCSDNGLIYRYNPEPRGRVLSLVWVSVLFLAVTILVWTVGNKHLAVLLPELPLDTEVLPLLLPGWFAILLGVLVHVAVAGVKRSRESGLPPVVAVKDWMLLFSARKGDIVVKILLALIGLFALVFLVGGNQFTVASAFFTGYSLDSFIGLFGESMDQKATAQLTTMRKKFGFNDEG